MTGTVTAQQNQTCLHPCCLLPPPPPPQHPQPHLLPESVLTQVWFALHSIPLSFSSTVFCLLSLLSLLSLFLLPPPPPPPPPPLLLPDLHTTDASRPQMTVTAAYSSPILFMSHNASVYLRCPLSPSLSISLSVCPSEYTVPQQPRFVNRGLPGSLPPPAADLHQPKASRQNHCDQMVFFGGFFFLGGVL